MSGVMGRRGGAGGLAGLVALLGACGGGGGPTVDEVGEQLAADGDRIAEWAGDAVGDVVVNDDAKTDMPCDNSEAMRRFEMQVEQRLGLVDLEPGDNESLNSVLDRLGEGVIAIVGSELGYETEERPAPDDLVERRIEFVKQDLRELQLVFTLRGNDGEPTLELVGETDCLPTS